MPPGLHGELARAAERERTSLNGYIIARLGEAIGRPVDYRDQPTIRAISRKAAENDYRMSSFILGVVQSDPFRMSQAGTTANNQQ